MLAERLKTLCQNIFTEFSFSENNIHIIGNISYHSYSQNDQEELIALKRNYNFLFDGMDFQDSF